MKRMLLFVACLALFALCGCGLIEWFYFYDAEEEYYATNLTRKSVVLEFSPCRSVDVNHELLFPDEESNADSSGRFWGRVRFLLCAGADSSFLFRRHLSLGHSSSRSGMPQKYCDFLGVITVYNLTDTVKVVLPGREPLCGNEYSKFEYEVEGGDSWEILHNHFLLMANDTLLSMMEKDYGMLDEFPEYYGGNTSVDAR